MMSSKLTERQKQQLKPGDYQLVKLRHQNTYRHMKFTGLQNATLQNFAKKHISGNYLQKDEEHDQVESSYLANKFDEDKRMDNKRDSLFQSDDTGTQMMDPFRTGETFFAIGMRDDAKPPEI